MARKTNSKTQTDAQRKAQATKIARMRKNGESWAEIKKQTGVKGSITGRKLMREFKLEGDLIRERKPATKKATKKVVKKAPVKKAPAKKRQPKGVTTKVDKAKVARDAKAARAKEARRAGKA